MAGELRRSTRNVSESKRDTYTTTEKHRYRQTKIKPDKKTHNPRHRDTHNSDSNSTRRQAQRLYENKGNNVGNTYQTLSDEDKQTE